MSNLKVNITSPVGRIVAGNLYEANKKDFDGNPLTVKAGPNAGQPRVNYFFALAIPKGQEQHWAQTEWGAKIWAVGHQSFPAAAQRPDFAWKIEDGDSQIPNKRGRKPCENEGWARHWILRFSGGFAPKIYRQEGSAYVQVTEANYVKPGYFVEVAFGVDGNGNQNNSGVYLNHSLVCFRAYGPEIVFGPNVEGAGFGASPLPAGASLTPPAGAIPMPASPVTPPAAPPVAPAAYPAPPPAAVAAPPIPVTPNPGFLQVPPVPGVTSVGPASVPPAIPGVSAMIAPPPSSSPQMTAKAAGASREAFVAAGWTDAQLIAQGYMTV
jgi:hypothetical protein